MIQDHLDHGALKEPRNPPEKVLWVSLMHHDPSDLGSLIPIWIILKEHTLNLSPCNSNTGFIHKSYSFIHPSRVYYELTL